MSKAISNPMEGYPLERAVIDSCAFDPKYAPEDQAALEIFALEEKGLIALSIAHSTEKEIDHPNTPSWVKEKALELIFTVEVDLTDEERRQLTQIETILAGRGSVEKIKSDAKHIFEAQKYCGHFITTDGRILKKAPPLESVCSVKIFKPSEFLLFLNEKLKAQLEREARRKRIVQSW